MRITGGKARSIPLKCPKGQEVRPATDRMREAVFSSIGMLVEGSSFLDLFAGAGTYGLEAISRGASRGTFVENNRSAVRSLTENLAMVTKSVGIHADHLPFSIQSSDVFKWLAGKRGGLSREKYTFVFIDPPYQEVDQKSDLLLEGLIPLLDSGSYIVFEVPHLLESFPTGYECIRTFGKGREDTRCMLLRWRTSEKSDA
jgi:16S rRNA (guanine966-N2)-methyltransferase